MKKRILIYYIPVILWCIMIYTLSSQSSLPGPATDMSNFVFKKLAHIFVYATLYWLFFRAINAGSTHKTYLIPLLVCIGYAVSDEFHQSFIAGRTSTIRDVGYDTLGMSITILKLRGLI